MTWKHQRIHSRGRKRARLPKPRKGMELILKEGLETIVKEDDTETPLRNVIILGNRKGFAYLAKYFDWLANREAHLNTHPDNDPDDHQHLEFPYDPFDAGLSDWVTFRFGTITPANRAAVFERYGVSRETAQRGSHLDRPLMRTGGTFHFSGRSRQKRRR